MSSFLVEDRTINEIVGMLNTDRFRRELERIKETAQIDPMSEYALDELAKAMFLMNVDAVNGRYGEGRASDFRALNFQFHYAMPSRVQALKSLTCYLYQCHEGDVPERPLYKALREFEHILAKDIVSEMPEYQRARWS